MKRLLVLIVAACGGDDGGRAADCDTLLTKVTYQDAMPCTVNTENAFTLLDCPEVVLIDDGSNTSPVCTNATATQATIAASQLSGGKRGLLIVVDDSYTTCEFRTCQ